jgi:RimJ/RimL family protein N-acetyltransferase
VAPRTDESLTTGRLVLRPWRDDAADLDAYAALSADPEVMRHVGAGSALTRAEAADGLRRFVAHWDDHGFGLYAVSERGSDRVLGFAGLARANETGVRPGDVEIGWRLERACWGRGYATEAALAVRAHAFERLRLARLVALIRPANGASIAVARKLGMSLEQERDCRRGLPMRIYALDNPAAAPLVD